MTFAIAKIVDRTAGKITLLADTKLTHQHDVTQNRHALANPAQKIVIVNGDIAIAVAGDTPASAIEKVVGLRGLPPNAIESALMSYAVEMQKIPGVTKSFLLITRKPKPRIIVIRNGIRDNRTEVGTGWIGDLDAYRLFNNLFLSDAAQTAIPDLEGRFMMAMVNTIAWDDVASVGGYLVRATGSATQPVRFGADPGFVLPGELEATFGPQPAGGFGVQLSLPPGADPTSHIRLTVRGVSPTYSALAQYIPEARTAWLHTHEEPWRNAIRLSVQSLNELVDVAKADHNQILDREMTQIALDRYAPC
ncbi:hypothetical protein FK535_22455 [Mycolicibacterium sp. 018/SC-01/001]|uniref:hypothetical protein n=1 Tax=Mycolicibacterium sp. 018/SC-01/001 TaxID=2592069 RepID=UPI00117CA895|nr:hypothetical protein [Mycolicibacterium sp. 018/SC-01/001]TRW79287.1 hypothetical protein FK535_22455 [Mycolicibacterium sp. 018/SC-01/001]